LQWYRCGEVLVRNKVRIVLTVTHARREQHRRLDILYVDIQVLEETLHLELEVELQVALVVNLAKQRQDGHRPRVRRLEDHVILRRLEDFRDERHGTDHASGLVALEDQLLDVQVTLKHRL